jgi:hypothetical protein
MATPGLLWRFFFAVKKGHHPLGLAIDRLGQYLPLQQSPYLGFEFLPARLTRPFVADVEL